MPGNCLVKTDLSTLRLLGESGEPSWTAPPPSSGEVASVDLLRDRARQAASWLAAEPGIRKRLDLVCLDVDEAMCSWVRASSEAMPVVSAALRSQHQDWGDLLTACSIEPLTEPRAAGSGMTLLPTWFPRRRPKPTPDGGALPEPEPRAKHLREPLETARLAVITLPDSLVRLWLDDLDRLGVRTDNVATLWHAMAAAWGDEADPASVSGIVLLEPGERLVWAWAKGQDLLAGGAVTLEKAREPAEAAPGEAAAPNADADDRARDAAVQRLALDWLTWGSQLGMAPSSMVLVGKGGEQLRAALAARWTRLEIRCLPEEDAIAATVRRASESGGCAEAPTNSRRGLARLASRPTRASRATFRLAACTLGLIAVAVLGLGIKLRAGAAEARSSFGAVREQSRQQAIGIDPRAESVPNVALFLTAALEELKKKEPFREPNPPREIGATMKRIAEILAEENGKLLFLRLDDGSGCELRVKAPDRRAAENIEAALLRGEDTTVRWSNPQRRNDQTELTIVGSFK